MKKQGRFRRLSLSVMSTLRRLRNCGSAPAQRPGVPYFRFTTPHYGHLILRRRRFREVFARFLGENGQTNFLKMIVFIAAIDSVQFSSKSEPSSRFFGCLKFSERWPYTPFKGPFKRPFKRPLSGLQVAWPKGLSWSC